MKVRLAFYKASWANWTDAIIAGWTWIWNPFSKAYSHVEIGFEFEAGWVYFSSSTRNNFKGAIKSGTRWIPGEALLKNRSRWDIYENDHYTIAEIEEMKQRANDIEGLPYDWWGILGFATITGQIINARNKWYCSESCWYILTNYWKKRISPRRMAKRILKKGFKLCAIL